MGVFCYLCFTTNKNSHMYKVIDKDNYKAKQYRFYL